MPLPAPHRSVAVLFFGILLVVLSATFSMSGVKKHYLTFPLDSPPLLWFLPDPCDSLVPLTLVSI